MTVYITPSHVIEYLYCPRFTYFEYVLNIEEREGKRFKVKKGREIHELKQLTNVAYLRKKFGVIKKEYQVELISPELGLKGIVDELYTLNDGSMAPFDYKYAEYKDRVFNTYRIQQILYAILISKTYNTEVNKTYICFTRSKNKIVEMEIKKEDKIVALEKKNACFEIITRGIFPKPTSYKRRCIDCSYSGICIK